MNSALIIGGSNGIGLALVYKLLDREYEKIYVVDRDAPNIDSDKIVFLKTNLIDDDYSVFDDLNDVNTIIYTAGFGRVAHFESILETEMINCIKVNLIGFMKIIKKYYHKIQGKTPFYCAAMGSIAGYISSPLFSVYGASKAGVVKFIESINVELAKKGTNNRILNVSPGSIKGTSFTKEKTDLNLLSHLAEEILQRMFLHEEEYIPEYDNVYKFVIKKYQTDKKLFGLESYDYKIVKKRINLKPQMKIGYLSGTFDLFHVGHLNLMKRAKQYCDYLVVGVHKDGSHKGKETYIPFAERIAIVESVRYVDKVIPSLPEDDDVYDLIKYDFLFVGSDYEGTERFNRYEKVLKPKGVKIIYFPYTHTTSSTQIRDNLKI